MATVFLVKFLCDFEKLKLLYTVWRNVTCFIVTCVFRVTIWGAFPRQYVSTASVTEAAAISYTGALAFIILIYD